MRDYPFSELVSTLSASPGMCADDARGSRMHGGCIDPPSLLARLTAPSTSLRVSRLEKVVTEYVIQIQTFCSAHRPMMYEQTH